jgi:peptide subunit release factor 1 (eRF1)
MAIKSTTALETPLRDQLDRLAAFDPSAGPVISLYLDMRPDHNGRRSHVETFLRNRVDEHARSLKGDERARFSRAAERIQQYINEETPTSSRALAIFASTSGDLFEAIPLDVPIDQSSLHLDSVPHLYPLARVNDQYPRYAALLVDTNSARLFVFALGAKTRQESVQNQKTRRSQMGGWAQARYQRHADNFHKQHIKEVVDLLEKVVARERLNHIVIACDDVAKPFLTAELKHLAEKVIDMVRVDLKSTPEHEVLKETMDALREDDARGDAEHVQRMLDAWRAGGLAVAGIEATMRALDMRQVEELLIAARPDRVAGPANTLVSKAQQNSARIRFVENDKLLGDVGGVGALLRFKI